VAGQYDCRPSWPLCSSTSVVTISSRVMAWSGTGDAQGAMNYLYMINNFECP
jgi:hypothetical protein